MTTGRTWGAEVSRISRQQRTDSAEADNQVRLILTITDGPEAGRRVGVWMDVTEAVRHIVAVTDAAFEADTRNRENDQ